MATCPTCRRRYPDDARTCEADGAGLLPDEAFSGVDPDLGPGHAVGEYRIERKLGEGGFGSVYAAVHPLIGKRAAIKVLNRQYSSNPQMVSRFIAEARAVNQIRHRNIIDIFSFGSLEDGRQYYLMELLDGLPFDRYLEQKGRLCLEEAVPILRQVARALDAAHARGIVHRDLKPENIYLVFDEDAGAFPKLLDFGIAKLIGDDLSGGHKTRTGTPIGTPHYMSPEQCRGREVDRRTDIYSFGAVVHETLTGKKLFDGDSIMDLLLKQTSVAPPPMSSICPDLAPSLDAPVLRMLEKDPAKRPESVAAALEELAQAAAAAGHAVSTPGALTPGRASIQRQTPGGAAHPGAAPAEGGAVVAARKRPMTPAEMEALAEARTMVGNGQPTQTLLGSAADVKPPSSRRAVLAVAITALLAGVTGAWLALRPSPPGAQNTATQAGPPSGAADGATGARGPSSAAPSAAKAEPTPAMPSGSAGAAPSVTPAGSASAGANAEVRLTVQATPANAEVFLGAERLGNAPGPVVVKRGDRKVKLTLKAPGYRPADVEVTPLEDGFVSATLLPQPAPGAAPPGGPRPAKPPTSEIENPF